MGCARGAGARRSQPRRSHAGPRRSQYRRRTSAYPCVAVTHRDRGGGAVGRAASKFGPLPLSLTPPATARRLRHSRCRPMVLRAVDPADRLLWLCSPQSPQNSICESRPFCASLQATSPNFKDYPPHPRSFLPAYIRPPMRAGVLGASPSAHELEARVGLPGTNDDLRAPGPGPGPGPGLVRYQHFDKQGEKHIPNACPGDDPDSCARDVTSVARRL